MSAHHAFVMMDPKTYPVTPVVSDLFDLCAILKLSAEVIQSFGVVLSRCSATVSPRTPHTVCYGAISDEWTATFNMTCHYLTSEKLTVLSLNNGLIISWH